MFFYICLFCLFYITEIRLFFQLDYQLFCLNNVVNFFFPVSKCVNGIFKCYFSIYVLNVKMITFSKSKIYFFFRTVFRLTAKLSRKYRVTIYLLTTPSPHTELPPKPKMNILHQGYICYNWWTCTDTSSPKYIFYIRVHSVFWVFFKLEYSCLTMLC